MFASSTSSPTFLCRNIESAWNRLGMKASFSPNFPRNFLVSCTLAMTSPTLTLAPPTTYTPMLNVKMEGESFFFWKITGRKRWMARRRLKHGLKEVESLHVLKFEWSLWLKVCRNCEGWKSGEEIGVLKGALMHFLWRNFFFKIDIKGSSLKLQLQKVIAHHSRLKRTFWSWNEVSSLNGLGEEARQKTGQAEK